MKRKLKQMVSASACVLALTISCAEDRESFYKSLDEARSDGAMKRGWIPNVLPASAHSIHEEHNLDTNRTWGAFAFASNDRAWLRRLKPLPADARLTVPSPGARWWVLDAATAADLKKSGFDVFVYEEPPFHAAALPNRVYFVVHKQEGSAFFWRSVS